MFDIVLNTHLHGLCLFGSLIKTSFFITLSRICNNLFKTSAVLYCKIFFCRLPLVQSNVSSIYGCLSQLSYYRKDHLGQSIQEWTKWNLWNTAFKKFEVIWSSFYKFHLIHSWILCLQFISSIVVDFVSMPHIFFLSYGSVRLAQWSSSLSFKPRWQCSWKSQADQIWNSCNSKIFAHFNYRKR